MLRKLRRRAKTQRRPAAQKRRPIILRRLFRLNRKWREYKLTIFDREENKSVTKAQKKAQKKVYVIIDGKKIYIKPDLVKKYGLDRLEKTFFSGLKIFVEYKK